MGEPVPGSNIDATELPKDKFDGFVVANGISIRVYWHSEVEAYVLEFPFLDVSELEVKNAGITNNKIFFIWSG